MKTHWKIALAALLLPVGTAGCGDDLVDVPADDSASDGEIMLPAADAGNDQLLADLDLNGIERVVLDGCASTAGSRPIVLYEWTDTGSVLDGVPGNGGCTLTVDLALGLHAIALRVVDAGGRSDYGRVNVDIRDPHPEVSILAPEDGRGLATGSETEFRASARDWTGRLLEDVQGVWTSDRDGTLGIGSTIVRTDLSRGSHVITVTVTDALGLAASESVTILVDDPPTVTILAPEDGRACALFDKMRLEGACVDRDGEPVTGEGVSWEPDMWPQWEPDIYTGMMDDPHHELSVEVVCDGLGPQTIALVCTDATGITGRAEVTVEYFPSYGFNVQAVLEDFGCTGCHGPSVQNGGIRLDTHLELTTGGNANGPLIVPGDATGGILIPKLLAVHYDPDWRTLTTPFDWGSVGAPWAWDSLEQYWVVRFLAPWIEAGALDN